LCARLAIVPGGQAAAARPFLAAARSFRAASFASGALRGVLSAMIFLFRKFG
jgi:hypothetical protein